jgi:hypothetical protein
MTEVLKHRDINKSKLLGTLRIYTSINDLGKRRSQESSVGISTGYGLDDRRGLGIFLYPASYQMGTRDSFPGGKAAAT